MACEAPDVWRHPCNSWQKWQPLMWTRMTSCCIGMQVDRLTATEVKIAFNGELLMAGGLQVWLISFETVRAMHLVPNTQASDFPCESLYSLIPAGTLLGHAATSKFCKQVRSSLSHATLPTDLQRFQPYADPTYPAANG